MRFLLVSVALLLVVVDSQLIPSNKPLRHLVRNYHADGYNYDDLPQSWDWRNVGGRSLVTVDRNQHSPDYCAATHAIADRQYIKQNGSGTQPMLSIQTVLSCAVSGGCHGGAAEEVFQYALDNNGIPPETCNPYQAKDGNCDKLARCFTCSPTEGCYPIQNYTTYTISNYGNLKGGPEKMKAEIYHHGPIACGIAVDDVFEAYSGGVYKTNGTSGAINHLIEVAGFGVDEKGVKYWIARNSWGTPWGENGWFRIVSTENEGMTDHHNLWIETECSYPTL
ncbi:Cathepsin X [Aphelenchoides besseyi]|nr:Cathepsin X [Aphelenchoides besseyi]